MDGEKHAKAREGLRAAEKSSPLKIFRAPNRDDEEIDYGEG
jgi:hypothetical protein